MPTAEVPDERRVAARSGDGGWSALPGRWVGGRDHTARRELAAGGLLVAVTALGGVYFALWPGPVPVDRWVGDLVGVHKGPVFSEVARLRYPVVVVVGSLVLAALTVLRDRWRALAVLVGAPLALGLCELVIKPLVGRTLGSGFSYPSGTTTGAAALATAAVLATPQRWRWVTGLVAGSYALWAGAAVVATQSHLPTDGLAGWFLGIGVVLVVDALSWRFGRSCRRLRPTRPLRPSGPAAGWPGPDEA
jgi:undecaprenyl-diphosphatase